MNENWKKLEKSMKCCDHLLGWTKSGAGENDVKIVSAHCKMSDDHDSVMAGPSTDLKAVCDHGPKNVLAHHILKEILGQSGCKPIVMQSRRSAFKVNILLQPSNII